MGSIILLLPYREATVLALVAGLSILTHPVVTVSEPTLLSRHHNNLHPRKSIALHRLVTEDNRLPADRITIAAPNKAEFYSTALLPSQPNTVYRIDLLPAHDRHIGYFQDFPQSPPLNCVAPLGIPFNLHTEARLFICLTLRSRLITVEREREAGVV